MGAKASASPASGARESPSRISPPYLARGYGVALVLLRSDRAGLRRAARRWACGRSTGRSTKPSRAPGEAGAIATWAEGLSLVRDHLALDPSVDGRRIALYGVSRLGKAALWAGANDPRFAAVISVCSGEGRLRAQPAATMARRSPRSRRRFPTGSRRAGTAMRQSPSVLPHRCAHGAGDDGAAAS